MRFTKHPDDGLCTGVQVFGFSWKLDYAAADCDSHADVENDDDHHGSQKEEERTHLIQRPV